ncbi:hypothetical protein A3J90_00345 [candidate division WOR-1 bacterium RIFOXYC2_FULL_37_10]|uniref:Uncharacterized protein n=1 Tax=candidate division WOR-1 bacterium RIFOXYB2_FULL_37_13 TaxID=1802579 RepID=A0A1F4SMU8_UNCSA|nr:MAG: hypothetical protein A2310_00230 [candidate division WOR-1 bacterium RIFOXYB2_FULL_37_13]OGC32582.1 MAG: hypothetical protein A3J90_00345 [candidate division WOR-1 bacterium RIFOXYC2_FULL_37_10]
MFPAINNVSFNSIDYVGKTIPNNLDNEVGGEEAPPMTFLGTMKDLQTQFDASLAFLQSPNITKVADNVFYNPPDISTKETQTFQPPGHFDNVI